MDCDVFSGAASRPGLRAFVIDTVIRGWGRDMSVFWGLPPTLNFSVLDFLWHREVACNILCYIYLIICIGSQPVS